MQKRFIIIIAAGVVIGFFVFAGLLFRGSTSGQGSITLTVIPRDAKVTIDQKKTVKPGKIGLSVGKHTLVISRSGFVAKTITVDITKAGDDQTQSIALGSESTAFTNSWQNRNPYEASLGEGITGSTANEQGQLITDKNPILKSLPYYGPGYSITFGPSQKYPNNDYAVAIVITASDQAARTKALNWITFQGYDPSKLEIIYK